MHTQANTNIILKLRIAQNKRLWIQLLVIKV